MLAVIAMLYTGVTYAVESLFDVGGIRVTFGVLHFYAACILIWAVIDLLSRDNTVVKVAVSAAIIVVTICLYYLYTPPADTPVFFAPLFGNGPSGKALFFRQESFSPGDFFPLIPYAAFFFPLLTIMSMIIGVIGGYVVVQITQIFPPFEYVSGIRYAVNTFYITYSIIKACIFGIMISTISAYYGYYAKGNSLEVGRSSTRAVVVSSIVILILDLVLTQIMLID